MKKQLKFAAVLSTSAFLALCAPLLSFADEGWNQRGSDWVYFNADGERVISSWIEQGENWYWMDENGVMAANGLVQIKGDYYYFREDGTMVSEDWVGIPNPNAGTENEPQQYWYYFQKNGKAYRRQDNGSTSIKAKTINGKKYAFDTEGRMLYGWVSEGTRQTGEDAWQYSDYYFGTEDDGAMAQGWSRIYIIDEDPDEEQPGSGFWEEEQDRWFYFDNGRKVKGKEGRCRFKLINNNKYGFDEYGRMISTWYSDTTTLATSRSESEDGKTYQGQEDYTRKFMYFGTPESGVQYTNGWFRARPSEYLMKSKYDAEETYMYYAEADGHIVANEIKCIDREYYGFDNAGRAFTGLVCLRMDNAQTSSQINYSFYSDTTENASRAPFATVGEFNHLVETFAEDFASGRMRIYSFSGTNGTMLTGAQQLQLGKTGDRRDFLFETTGALKGSGIHGEKNGKLYKAGLLTKPKDDQKYAIIKKTYKTLPNNASEEEKKDFQNKDVDGDGKIEGIYTEITIERFIQEVCNSGIYDNDDDKTVWTVRYDPPGTTYYLIDANGNIIKNTKRTSNMDGYTFNVKNKKIQTITFKE